MKVSRNDKDVHVLEKVFIIFISVIVCILFGLCFWNLAFVSSFLIMLSMLLFSIGYMMRNKKSVYGYILFGMGIILLMSGIIYTIVRVSYGI